ncbi:MAG: carboxypeptidase regulatory-like domain-containing protein [Acidimicrobiia bacterium]|nr:carboxypeptidase regulatory-like domain-containing protein [Acidimicrobiia bacterium]
MTARVRSWIAAVGVAVLASGALTWVDAQQAQVAIDPDDIGGVVTGDKGPEAGVWVIAETTDLPTKLARSVVTDDQGRYVVPDLPRGNYQVWVRGYGLVDSPKQTAKPGQQLNLKATTAPDAKTAAQVYPAAWWLSMVPAPDGAENQLKFAQTIKQCYDCHQLGSKATREMNPVIAKEASSTADAWDRRVRVGPSGPTMAADFMRLGDHRRVFAEWTDRIAKGEAPKNPPPRPKGVERNLVVTTWDWGNPTDGRSDAAAADLRNPSANANGPVFGVTQMVDSLNMLDPVEHRATKIPIPVTAPPLVSAFNAAPNPSPYWGENVWKRVGDPRSVGMDAKGRVWFTMRNRAADQQPAYCTGGGGNKFGRHYPLKQSNKQVAVYDPKTKKFEQIDTCFNVDHNEFDEKNNVYYGMPGSVGWVNMDTWDKTHNAEQSQGWCPAVIDTNGDGRITPGWTEPDQPVDPKRDHRIQFGCYSVAVNPKDGTMWCSDNGVQYKRLVRIEKGPNPPETCKAEYYEPPPGLHQGLAPSGSGGLVIGHDGVAWQGWRVSGHFTAFDRSKCKSTKDPQANGQSCPEGWTILRNTNEPTYANSLYKSTEAYLNYMDINDTLGLGKDAPLYGSMNTDSMEVYSPTLKQFVTLRVPYPLGFFARSGTGRIDDPKTGWKGKGYWSSYSTYASWHIEGGKGTLPKAIKFQMRPNPLAK